jgi:hypothetical protein
MYCLTVLYTSTSANVPVRISLGCCNNPYHDSIVSSHWFRNSHICLITGSDIAIGLDPETVPHNTVDPNSVFQNLDRMELALCFARLSSVGYYCQARTMDQSISKQSRVQSANIIITIWIHQYGWVCVCVGRCCSRL